MASTKVLPSSAWPGEAPEECDETVVPETPEADARGAEGEIQVF